MTNEPKDMGSFEWLRQEVLEMAPASSTEDRDLLWADEEHQLAVARDPDGRVEIFVVGDPLHPATRAVRDHVQHQHWQSVGGGKIAANRLVLPHTDGFDGAAAFICAELLANGLHDDPTEAFASTEPVIAMLLGRVSAGDEMLVGLVGELLVLHALLAAVKPAGRPEILESWAGSTPSSRDFQLGEIGVEVKTTPGPTSKHHIQGFHQVEPGISIGDVPETALFLLSLGIRWLTADVAQGWSVASLVKAIVALLPDDASRESMLFKARQYGGDGAHSYHHAKDRELPSVHPALHREIRATLRPGRPSDPPAPTSGRRAFRCHGPRLGHLQGRLT